MQRPNSLVRYPIVFGLPLLLIVGLVLLTQTSNFQLYQKELSIGISIDLLLTVPFVFFLMIRKTKIPKTALVPLTVLAMLVGYAIVPKENQGILDTFKHWILPCIEVVVLLFIGYKIYRAVRQYQHQKKSGFDFYTTVQNTCNELFPKKVAALLTSELAVIYYSVWTWKKRPLTNSEFSYHKNSGTLTLLVAIIGIIGIETFVFHIVLAKWNTIAAMIVTGLSIYTCIQFFGFLKSMTRRPITIQGDILYLRYGMMAETAIPIQQIVSVTLSTKDLEQNKMHKKLSFLGDMEGHNVVLKVVKPQVLHGLYGTSKKYEVLGFYVDAPIPFKALIDEKISVGKR